MNAKERISKKSDDWIDGERANGSSASAARSSQGGVNLAPALGGEPYVEAPAGTAHTDETGGITATMQAINRNSKNPERAMMLLNCSIRTKISIIC